MAPPVRRVSDFHRLFLTHLNLYLMICRHLKMFFHDLSIFSFKTSVVHGVCHYHCACFPQGKNWHTAPEPRAGTHHLGPWLDIVRQFYWHKMYMKNIIYYCTICMYNIIDVYIKVIYYIILYIHIHTVLLILYVTCVTHAYL